MAKFCSNCGKELEEGSNTCKYCTKVENGVTTDTKEDKHALNGFILGLISILAWFIPLIGYPVTICGIVFSAEGLKSNKKNLAIAGLILSILFLVVTIINSFLGAMIGFYEFTNNYNYY